MPLKFKSPKFVKYNGTGGPYAYWCMFCKKIAPYGDNKPLLNQIFPDSLIGPVATWYVRLEKTSSWREMANAFLEYYQFNTEIATNRIVLQRTEKEEWGIFMWVCLEVAQVDRTSASSHDGRGNDQVVYW